MVLLADSGDFLALCHMQHHEGAQAAPLKEAVQVLTVEDSGTRCHAWFCIWRALGVTQQPEC